MLDTDPVDTDPVDTDPVDTDEVDTDPVLDTDEVDTDPADTDTGEPGVPPFVIDTNLRADAPSVATNRAVTATFDLPMDAGSVIAHFLIVPPVPSVDASFDVSSNTLVFAPPPLAPTGGMGPTTPTAFLAPDTVYTVTILAGAEDALGVALAEDYTWSFRTGLDVNELPAGLGSLAPVALLGATVVGTAPPTMVFGDVASIGALSGFVDLEAQVTGVVYSPGTESVPADMLTDFALLAEDLRGRAAGPALPFSAVIAAAGPLSPGRYVSAPAVSLTADLVLDAGNDRDATFIFQVTGAFGLAAGVSVILEGGADPSNIFWISDGAVALGANATLRGTVVTPAALTVGADGLIDGGRLLTKDGALTLGAATMVPTP